MKVYARLNWGRWIADCPDCNGAEMVYEGRAFICGSCFPAYLGGTKHEVVFPPEKAEIDRAVLGRPVANMNWERGETVAFLKRDNKIHGIKEAV